MLQRQKWCSSRLCSPSFRLIPPVSDSQTLRGHSQYRRNHTLSTSSPSRQARKPFGVASPCSSALRCHQYSIRQGESKPRRAPIAKTPEPWIIPNSLSDTLDAHRQANQGGIARDGTPIKLIRRERKSINLRSAHNPRIGTNVWHLALPQSSEVHRTEYGGACPPLLSEWHPSRHLPQRLRFPWISRLDRHDSIASMQSATLRLNAEIRACEDYFSGTLSEKRAASYAFAEITSIVRQRLGFSAAINIIGSRAAGTEGPTSDLDINVKIPTNTDGADLSEYTTNQLRGLDKHMRSPKFKDSLSPHLYLRNAHIPIVVGTHIPSGLEFQIQSTTSAYDSLEVVKAFVAEYPSARILFKIIKQMLLMRGLTKGNLGGITSYPLLNMVVTSLKLANTHIPVNDTASQLLHFLNFWSEFNFDMHRIALTPDCRNSSSVQQAGQAIDPISTVPHILPKDPKTGSNRYMMSLEDPADPTNDLGKSASEMKHVQACLIEARGSLRRSMQEWDDLAFENDEKIVRKPLLAWCLGGDYTTFEEARLQLSRYGSKASNNVTSSSLLARASRPVASGNHGA